MLSVGRPQTLHGNVHQVDHVPNGGKLLVAVTRERRYGPSRLRVNDDDHIVCGAGYMKRSSVRPSVCLPRRLTAATATGGFAAERLLYNAVFFKYYHYTIRYEVLF